MPKRVPPIVLLNPKSRRGDEWNEAVRSAIGDRAASVSIPKSSKAFHDALAEAVEKKTPEIWIGGGDGTIRQAAKQLVHSKSTLGILPMGTGNALATELGIPAHPEKMVEFLFEEAVERSIDVGMFNDEVFVNVATMGITAGIAQALKNTPKQKLGRLAYLPAVIQATLMTRSIPLTVKSKEGTFEGRALQFVAASTRLHGGPFPVTPESSIRDGKLSCYVVKKGERGAIFKYGLGLVLGHHTDLEEVWAVESPELELTAGRSVQFVLDGDLIRAKAATLKALPAALRVLGKPVAKAEDA